MGKLVERLPRFIKELLVILLIVIFMNLLATISAPDTDREYARFMIIAVVVVGVRYGFKVNERVKALEAKLEYRTTFKLGKNSVPLVDPIVTPLNVQNTKKDA